MKLYGCLNQVDTFKWIIQVKVLNLVVVFFLLDQVPDGIGDVEKKTGKEIMSGFYVEIIFYSVLGVASFFK